MKKICCLMLLTALAVSSNAQSRDTRHWSIGVNAKAGRLKQKMEVEDFSKVYTDAFNVHQGGMRFENGNSYGGDLQISYYIGKKANFGIGTGIMYLRQAGNIAFDNFSVHYRAVDGNNDEYRQMLSTSWPFKEEVVIENINLPLMLKYRGQLSDKIGIALEAGALYNLSVGYRSSGNAAFNHEAAYHFVATDAGYKAAFSNTPTPSPNDWLITGAHYQHTLTDGNAKAYLQYLRTQGYNVGYKEPVGKEKQEVNYESGSIGFLVQPSFTYRINSSLMLQVGGYYMVQSFENPDSKGYKITDRVGSYNSVTKAVIKTDNTSYGANVGLQVMF